MLLRYNPPRGGREGRVESAGETQAERRKERRCGSRPPSSERRGGEKREAEPGETVMKKYRHR